MSAFVVLLHDDEPESNAKLRAGIEERFAGWMHYKFSDHAYLVTGVSSMSDVSSALGFDDDESLHAAVLQLSCSFGGRSWMNLWEWVRMAEKR